MSMRFTKCLEAQLWNRWFSINITIYGFIDSSIINTYIQVKVTNNITIAVLMDISMNIDMNMNRRTTGNM